MANGLKIAQIYWIFSRKSITRSQKEDKYTLHL